MTLIRHWNDTYWPQMTFNSIQNNIIVIYTPEIGMKHVSHFNSQMIEKVKKWNIDNWAAILEMTSLKEGPSRPDFNFCPKCVANIHMRSLDEIIRWYLFSNKMHYGKLWDSLNFDKIVIRYQYHTSWLDKVYYWTCTIRYDPLT